MSTINSEQLQQLLADVQLEQSKLREALDLNSKRLTLVEDAIKATIDRLERPERNYDTLASKSPATAGPKLVSIPELLETVLLNLPIRDLLLAQSVNKTFHAVIHRSEAIQRRLFFLPEPAPPRIIRESDVRINPLLFDERSFVGIPLYGLYREDHRNTGLRPVFVRGSQWNSRKLKIANCQVRDWRAPPTGRRTCQLIANLERLPGTVCYGLEDKVSKSTRGSWKNMYWTQPPIRILYINSVGTVATNGSADGTTFGTHFPWKTRRARVGSAGNEVDDPIEGEEIDASDDGAD